MTTIYHNFPETALCTKLNYKEGKFFHFPGAELFTMQLKGHLQVTRKAKNISFLANSVTSATSQAQEYFDM